MIIMHLYYLLTEVYNHQFKGFINLLLLKQINSVIGV